MPTPQHNMPNNIRIALAQTSPAGPPAGLTAKSERPFGYVEDNLAEVAEWTAKAAKQGADVVMFPEFCVHAIFGKECLVSDFGCTERSASAYRAV